MLTGAEAAAPLRVGIIVGGRSPLAAHSRKTGEMLKDRLRHHGWRCEVIEYDGRLADRLRADEVDLLYDVTFGVYGRVGLLAELFHLPLVGNSGVAAQVYDKVVLKERLKCHGFCTPQYLLYDRYTFEETWEQMSALPGPVVVKPASADLLSYGVRRFDAWEDKRAAVKAHVESLFAVDDRVMVEQFVAGEEWCVGYSALEAAGLFMFPPMSIRKDAVLFDHETKMTGSYAFVAAALMPEDLHQLRQAGEALAKDFEIGHYFYLNAIRDGRGAIQIIDAGTTVGLGPKSYFPAAAKLLGLSVEDLVMSQLRASGWTSVDTPKVQ